MKILLFLSKFPKDKVVLAWNSCSSQYFKVLRQSLRYTKIFEDIKDIKKYYQDNEDTVLYVKVSQG